MTPDSISMLTKGPTFVEARTSHQQYTIVQARTALLAESQDSMIADANSPQYWNAAKQIMQSQGKPALGPYRAVIAQAARALGYDNVGATNCHIRKWQGI
jgi:hypothetical protein